MPRKTYSRVPSTSGGSLQPKKALQNLLTSFYSFHLRFFLLQQSKKATQNLLTSFCSFHLRFLLQQSKKATQNLLTSFCSFHLSFFLLDPVKRGHTKRTHQLPPPSSALSFCEL
jgi:hypothetical protein